MKITVQWNKKTQYDAKHKLIEQQNTTKFEFIYNLIHVYWQQSTMHARSRSQINQQLGQLRNLALLACLLTYYVSMCVCVQYVMSSRWEFDWVTSMMNFRCFVTFHDRSWRPSPQTHLLEPASTSWEQHRLDWEQHRLEPASSSWEQHCLDWEQHHLEPASISWEQHCLDWEHYHLEPASISCWHRTPMRTVLSDTSSNQVSHNEVLRGTQDPLASGSLPGCTAPFLKIDFY